MKKNSCFVIGGDTLLIECCKQLIEKGFFIEGVISNDQSIISWIATEQIEHIAIDENLFSRLEETQFEYLFSIAHLEVIDASILKLPTKLSINFHDAPLPRYAGLNCPVWSIINQEPVYGISWHQITPGVDCGDILLTREFPVSPEETALSLNTKCFANALESFPVLLQSLLDQDYVLSPQDAAERSYFARSRRPANACLLDWKKPAEELNALIRALDFGGYPNLIGLPKLLFGQDLYYPVSAIVRESTDANTKNPGEIVSIEEGELGVATAEGELVINSILDDSANSVSIAKLVNKHNLNVGSSLLWDRIYDKNELTESCERLAKHEPYWTTKLLHLSNPELPVALLPQDSLHASEESNNNFTELDTEIRFENRALALSCIGIVLLKISGQSKIDLHFSDELVNETYSATSGLISDSTIVTVKKDASIKLLIDTTESALETAVAKGTWYKDLILRQPTLSGRAELSQSAIIPIGFACVSKLESFTPLGGALITLVWSENDKRSKFIVDSSRTEKSEISKFVEQFRRVAQDIQEAGFEEKCFHDISLLSSEEIQQQVVDWNDTSTASNLPECVHQQFEQQALLTPEEIALVFEQQAITYRELNVKAESLAAKLIDHGVKPDKLVGVCVDRSIDLMVATLGILKAGGAYVPLDPDFPVDRLHYMIEDSGLDIIVTQKDLSIDFSTSKADLLFVDEPTTDHPEPITANVSGDNLAYVIYTSGSTGKPKGVMVEHRNVTNFFTGMDSVVKKEANNVWMAVTSLSFDISVLELFWTLARGFKVIIYKDRLKNATSSEFNAEVTSKPMDFGLFMWGNDDAPGSEKYRLMLEGAKYFDQNKFNSIWTPERHFHAFGGPYPNPAVTSAAIAAITENISIRAGSCVSPLHHPIRIAEDWSVIDNLSNGRVGLSFASGWQPNDFVICPENHKNNKQIMLEQVETVRKLWRGEPVSFKNPMGDMVDISTLPRPVQKELPVWVTTAGNPETYKQAGAQGANVLTHLLGQTLDELAEKIRLYREARAAAGYDPASGIVSLMLHTFVGRDTDAVRELVREPMKDYLRSSMKLVVDFAWSFPAFKKPEGGASDASDVDIGALTEEESETILDFAFERYFENSGLFGSPDICVEMVNKCKNADINEIACLLDYGCKTDDIMDSLPLLKEVRDRTNQVNKNVSGISFVSQLRDHNVTHMQCTPSMARMLVSTPEESAALKKLPHLMIGGEAFPPGLALDLNLEGDTTVTNMYGPTETTIWSTTQAVNSSHLDAGNLPIGRPIANTSIYILDDDKKPVPIGVAGNLYIGGKGVVRGYLGKPELTAERFVENPFTSSHEEKMYFTGDLAKYQSDGTIEFIGRVDHQVKVRGYRIELGEIEAALTRLEGINQAATILRDYSEGDKRIVAYCVFSEPKDPGAIKDDLKESLPEYMIPADIVALPSLPLTPNGKVDRNALPAPESSNLTGKAEFQAPEQGLEKQLAELWQSILRIDKVGVKDNFFDLGGHSLLIVKLHAEVNKISEKAISLTDLYRFPTIQSIVNHIASGDTSENLKKSSDRAQRRREMTRNRRRR